MLAAAAGRGAAVVATWFLEARGNFFWRKKTFGGKNNFFWREKNFWRQEEKLKKKNLEARKSFWRKKNFWRQDKFFWEEKTFGGKFFLREKRSKLLEARTKRKKTFKI